MAKKIVKEKVVYMSDKVSDLTILGRIQNDLKSGKGVMKSGYPHFGRALNLMFHMVRDGLKCVIEPDIHEFDKKMSDGSTIKKLANGLKFIFTKES
jgi:hypothetical protein